MDEHDDLVASDNESFQLASAFGPGIASPGDVCHYLRVPAIRPGSGIVWGFDPLHLRIEEFDGGRNIVSVDGGVDFFQRLDLSGTRRRLFDIHDRRLPVLIA